MWLENTKLAPFVPDAVLMSPEFGDLISEPNRAFERLEFVPAKSPFRFPVALPPAPRELSKSFHIAKLCQAFDTRQLIDPILIRLL